MKKISVIIPCYNVERYIVECVQSVVKQHVQVLEIICINDGSSDGTLACLKKLAAEQPELIKIIDKKNEGAAIARNVGLLQASGDFIQFLDADDVITPGKFETQLNGFDAGTDIVVSDWVLKDNDLGKELKAFYFDDIGKNPLETAVKKVISTCNPLYRIAVVKRIDGYDSTLNSAQDWDFHLRLILAGSIIKYIPGVFFTARQVSGSVSSNWVKVSDQACEIIMKLEPQLLQSKMMNVEIKKYFSQLFFDSAVYSKEKKNTERYMAGLIKWSGNNYSFISSRLKRAVASFAGIRTLIGLQKIKNKFT